MLVQKVLKNAYIWIPNPTSIVLDKISISLTTIWQTEQLTATIEPTISDHSITWSSDDTTVATVSTSGLVTCVTPWECTITATTVNGLTATCSVTQSIIPSAYQEVEYIQSSWTQYINTLFTPSNTTKVEWKMGGWSQSWSHQMFGSRYSWSSTWRWFAIITDAYQFNGYGWVDHWMTDWADHSWEFSQTWIYVDWVLKTTPSTTTFTSPWPLYLFWLNSNWSFTESAAMKYYYFKIYDNWTLVRDFIPCYRIADSVIWMYDVVNGVFYTNQWSWTFTKWPDVN